MALELLSSIVFTAVVGIVLPRVLGAVSLRVGGIAFAMVTLAFAQAGSILAYKNPHKLDGRRGRARRRLPQAARRGSSASSTRSTSTGSRSSTRPSCSSIVQLGGRFVPGHVWQAIRENELRVQVLGLRPYGYKLMSFVLASFLATAGGVVYLLLLGGATPR